MPRLLCREDEDGDFRHRFFAFRGRAALCGSVRATAEHNSLRLRLPYPNQRALDEPRAGGKPWGLESQYSERPRALSTGADFSQAARLDPASLGRRLPLGPTGLALRGASLFGSASAQPDTTSLGLARAS